MTTMKSPYFCKMQVLQDRVVSPAPPNPNLEDQWIALSLASTLGPVRHGWPYHDIAPAGIALGDKVAIHRGVRQDLQAFYSLTLELFLN